MDSDLQHETGEDQILTDTKSSENPSNICKLIEINEPKGGPHSPEIIDLDQMDDDERENNTDKDRDFSKDYQPDMPDPPTDRDLSKDYQSDRSDPDMDRDIYRGNQSDNWDPLRDRDFYEGDRSDKGGPHEERDYRSSLSPGFDRSPPCRSEVWARSSLSPGLDRERRRSRSTSPRRNRRHESPREAVDFEETRTVRDESSHRGTDRRGQPDVWGLPPEDRDRDTDRRVRANGWGPPPEDRDAGRRGGAGRWVRAEGLGPAPDERDRDADRRVRRGPPLDEMDFDPYIERRWRPDGRGRRSSRSISPPPRGSRNKAPPPRRNRSRSRSRTHSRSRSPSRSWSRSLSPYSRRGGGPRDRLRDERPPPAPSPLCRDFIAGRCRRGPQCRFSHHESRVLIENYQRNSSRGIDVSSSSQGYKGNFEGNIKSSERCFDFSRGRCTRGASCRYSHHEAPLSYDNRGMDRNYGERTRSNDYDIDNNNNNINNNSNISREEGRRVKKEELCKFFVEGRCGRGEGCRFSHDVADRVHGENANEMADWSQQLTLTGQPKPEGTTDSITISTSNVVLSSSSSTGPDLVMPTGVTGQTPYMMRGQAYPNPNPNPNLRFGTRVQVQEQQQQQQQPLSQQVIFPVNPNPNPSVVPPMTTGMGNLTLGVPPLPPTPPPLVGMHPPGFNLQAVQSVAQGANPNPNPNPNHNGQIQLPVADATGPNYNKAVSSEQVAKITDLSASLLQFFGSMTPNPNPNPNHNLPLPVLSEKTETQLPELQASPVTTKTLTLDSKKEEGGSSDQNPNKTGKESKGLKLFKCALVEVVKDLLKPSWKEGQLSREVHKTIVRKVVDKVTGTVEGSNNLPQTQEKINLYLAHSKPKLTKLVQAYVEKYVKN